MNSIMLNAVEINSVKLLQIESSNTANNMLIGFSFEPDMLFILTDLWYFVCLSALKMLVKLKVLILVCNETTVV